MCLSVQPLHLSRRSPLGNPEARHQARLLRSHGSAGSRGWMLPRYLWTGCVNQSRTFHNFKTLPCSLTGPGSGAWLTRAACQHIFKQRWTEMTIFQPARSMNQNLMEEPNLSLGSVNAECLQNWTVRGSTEESHSVLELCLPSSEMQRVRRAHTRRIASSLCPTDSEGPRRSWWEILSSEMHSFLQCVTAKSGSLCDTVEKKKPLYSICLSEGWIAWERRICLERLGGKESDKQVWAPYLAHSNYFPSDKQTISSFLISSRSGFAV